MTKKNKIRLCARVASIALSLVFVTALQARTDTNHLSKALNTSSGFTAPPPFTAAEFWNDIASLMSLNHAYIRVGDVEKKFNVKFTHRSDFGEAGVLQFTMPGIDWYFKIIVKEYGNRSAEQRTDFPNPKALRSLVYIGLPAHAFSSSEASCLTSNMISHNLLSGWQSVPSNVTQADLQAPYVLTWRDALSGSDLELHVAPPLSRGSQPANLTGEECVISLMIEGK